MEKLFSNKWIVSFVTIFGLIGSYASMESLFGISEQVKPFITLLYTFLSVEVKISPLIIIILVVFIATVVSLPMTFIFKKKSAESRTLSNFLNKMEVREIDDSICGIYFGIRKMAPDNPLSNEELYYSQYLCITKSKAGECQFAMYGSWKDEDFYVEGSCVRVENHLILYGATDENRGTFQLIMLAYPLTATSNRLKGLISLKRIDITASVSTRVAFTKKSINRLPISPRQLLTELFIKEQNKHFARDISGSPLSNNADIVTYVGSDNLKSMLMYVNETQNIDGIIHS
ncbi:hypothetical protein M0C34_04640 [Agarivorans sp. TSD2052]|uniref:hypothetical protein n=1 Tax=Agarivorans sp. TSD2052 TaxID=2937286 RepID=UPI00200C347A|nr:hypothetical protein [Agarivorans sp. TSD2052]UPW19571.1 hypothetical protein M0C34_04640 [Agarivorans sp. TSD2052]